MATQNDDLDLQTFQIYHEDEEEVKAAQEKAAAEAEEAANKKSGKGKTQEKKGLFSFSFGKKEVKKGQVAPTKGNKKVPPAPAAPKAKAVKKIKASSGMNDATKGILIGFVVLGLFIALDQLGFLKF